MGKTKAAASGQTVGGVEVPRSALAAEATRAGPDTISELVYHHSRRVFSFGALQGRRRDLSFDPEPLYVGAAPGLIRRPKVGAVQGDRPERRR